MFAPEFLSNTSSKTENTSGRIFCLGGALPEFFSPPPFLNRNANQILRPQLFLSLGGGRGGRSPNFSRERRIQNSSRNPRFFLLGGGGRCNKTPPPKISSGDIPNSTTPSQNPRGTLPPPSLPPSNPNTKSKTFRRTPSSWTGSSTTPTPAPEGAAPSPGARRCLCRWPRLDRRSIFRETQGDTRRGICFCLLFLPVVFSLVFFCWGGGCDSPLSVFVFLFWGVCGGG